MSPPARLASAASRSGGVQALRARTRSRKPGAWASMPASIRSRNDSVDRSQPAWPAAGPRPRSGWPGRGRSPRGCACRPGPARGRPATAGPGSGSAWPAAGRGRPPRRSGSSRWGVADVDDGGPPALLGRPRHLAVEGPVDLEGAEAGPVVADLGQGPGRERLLPGQADQAPTSRAPITARRALSASPPASTPTARPRSTTIRSTRRPVRSPPRPRAALAARASVILPVPPSTTGMPKRWPSMVSSRAYTPVPGSSGWRSACMAGPVRNALACSDSKRSVTALIPGDDRCGRTPALRTAAAARSP
jgi:RNA polymerase-associated protein LEO1/transcription factor SPN1